MEAPRVPLVRRDYRDRSDCKIRMIQDIESFSSKLQADVFSKREFPMQRKVNLPRSKSTKNVATELAPGVGWRDECGAVEALTARIFRSVEIQRLDWRQVWMH